MLLVYGLTKVGNGDTSYLTYLVLAAAAAVLASFIAIERYSAAPLLPGCKALACLAPIQAVCRSCSRCTTFRLCRVRAAGPLWFVSPP